MKTWEYLLQRIEVDNKTGCWNWIAGKTSRGYGMFGNKDDGKCYTHRVSYELTYGEIPMGYIIRHKCDNTSCINPNHLESGTHADNMEDMVKRNRVAKWERKAIKLTGEQVLNIRKDGRSQIELSKLYGVSQQYISKIKRNLVWVDYE